MAVFPLVPWYDVVVTYVRKGQYMFSNFGLFDLSTPSLLIILAVIILLFGAKAIPKLSKSIGESAKELRKGLKDDDKPNDKPQA